jgi:hypothetical protein
VTAKKKKILDLMMDGLHLEQIADILKCSEGNVKHHLKGIYRENGIEWSGPFIPSLRLVYLEARRRGLLDSAIYPGDISSMGGRNLSASGA